MIVDESRRVRCPECTTPVRETALNQLEPSPCSGCDNLLLVEIYPAYFRKTAPGPQAEVLLMEGESACFYHPGKKAVIPCQACGRFLCALCDCDLNGEHFCPRCLETGRTKGKIKNIENSRTQYDSMALVLATAPMLIFYFTFLTAPAALFLGIRHWNSPRSVTHSTKVRLILAIVFATLQIVGWGLLVVGLIVGWYA